MSKQESNMDGMLRHLGAAYYDSLHGRAAPADVARAVDTIAEHIGEEPGLHPAKPAKAGTKPASSRQHHHGRWRTRMRDVMTTSVVTVDRITPYKEIAGLLAGHRISGVPVLGMGRKVTGIVSEADLLAARAGHITATGRRVLSWPSGRKRHQGLTAAQLMTSPAITIYPDASVAAAARLMNAHRIRRLPVVDPEGKLMGIVSRRDLLTVFLRPDEQIAREVRDIFAELLPDEPDGIEVTVHNGIVTLTGHPAAAGHRDLLPIAVRLAWDVEGVVDVVDRVREDGARIVHGH
jgi:CBS domain-containing protein